MQSPCVKICTYDAASGLCSGCGRTLAEIGGWAAMTDDQRRAVMEDLPRRLRGIVSAPAPPPAN
ncbi:MAG: DUF1289 domain-containing protein [Alphaproteobacteria bacterium 65-7]|nr:MAG: DUF1289 domain-containing protein [Alphaproteobacteria bacterium 65-7]